jgi:hypothetical protein
LFEIGFTGDFKNPKHARRRDISTNALPREHPQATGCDLRVLRTDEFWFCGSGLWVCPEPALPGREEVCIPRTRQAAGLEIKGCIVKTVTFSSRQDSKKPSTSAGLFAVQGAC